MKALKAFNLMVLAATLVVATVGCSRDKGDKRANVSNRQNRSTHYNQPHNPNMPPNQSGQGVGGWGQIYNQSGSFPNLHSFMVGITDLGFVSGMQGDRTGFRFRGQVDVCNKSGRIDLLVWDDAAYNFQPEPMPYFWTSNVVDVYGNGQQITIVVEDSAGRITFNGHDNGSQYTGQVSFQNSNGASGTLGLFKISTNSLLYCN